jgi:hypothetical protein
MTNILNRVARYAGHFSPGSPQEYLALQVAKKLGDTPTFRNYLVLFEHYPEDLLLKIFKRCSENGTLTGEHYMRAFRELTMQN